MVKQDILSMPQTEYIVCNLCGEDNTETLANRERFGTSTRSVICRNCGLIYLNPRWPDEVYGGFYENEYRQLMGESSISLARVMLRQRIHGAQILSFCLPYVDSHMRVLDIGCAAGGVLAAFSEGLGTEVLGVEPNLEQARYAHDQLGFDIKIGMFEDFKWDPGTFDFAILTQTLNHFLDPYQSLQAIWQALETGGLLFLEVQNFPEYAKRQANTNAFQLDHTYYFAPEVLEAFVQRIGFTIIKVSVDTAHSAAGVSEYMWHRSAPIHTHMLLRRTEPELDIPLPDYRPIYSAIQKSIRFDKRLLDEMRGMARSLLRLFPLSSWTRRLRSD